MNLLQAMVLGVIQGLTEFLPISSSAHLVITPYIFGWEIPTKAGFIFDVLVQLGTLLAVIVYFRHDVIEIILFFCRGIIQSTPFKEPQARLGWHIILATIPAGVVGFFIKKQVEIAFQSPRSTALFLLLTAFLLAIGERVGKRYKDHLHINWLDAIWIGLCQSFAIFPGVSRSGATLFGGMTRGLSRYAAAKFSFLMSIPIMLVASSAAILDLTRSTDMMVQFPALLVGFITSMITGYFSIHWLLKFLNSRSLYSFSVYCFIMGVAVLILTYLR